MKQPIGIITALDIELDLFEKNLELKEEVNICGLRFLKGKINNVPVAAVKSGVGKVNAAFAATLLIKEFNPSLVIMTGVAGGIKDLKVLDTVIASYVVQHDCDSTAAGHPRGFLDCVFAVEIYCSKEANQIILENCQNVKLGVIATGDQFIASDEAARQIHKEFGAIAVEMEGGAVGQVAYLTNTPFVMIRVISDDGHKNAFETFENYAKKAADSNSSLVIKVLPKIYEVKL